MRDLALDALSDHRYALERGVHRDVDGALDRRLERARIAGQLNKGETLHALRRHLVIGSRAQIPADEDDHRRHALCLQMPLAQVRAERHEVQEGRTEAIELRDLQRVAVAPEPKTASSWGRLAFAPLASST